MVRLAYSSVFLISHLPFYVNADIVTKGKKILQINELHLDNATRRTQ